MKLFDLIKDNSPTILSGLAIVGIFGTVVLTAKASYNACFKINDLAAKKFKEEGSDEITITKAEKFKTVWKDYIPAVAVGVGTIACIVGANILNKKKQASLVSAYTLLNTGFKRYSGKLRELYGQEAHDKIIDELSVEDANPKDILRYDMCGNVESGFDDEDEDTVLFCEMLSPSKTPRYFRSKPTSVMAAFLSINRMYALGGSPSVNHFYDFLGIDRIDGCDAIGWDICTGMPCIDFNTIKHTLDDGAKYYIIDTPYVPDVLEEYCDN